MSDDRVRVITARVSALSDAQRQRLAEALRLVSTGRTPERLVAFVVLAPGSAPNDAALRSVLAERLPDYAIPSRFVAVERLPRTGALKLDRKALAGMTVTELDAPASSRGATPPRTELEARLVAIWKDVLKVSHVGVDDDFFEIGGDSLLSIRVIARAGREGIRISPERFFERATVAHMAASVLTDGSPTRPRTATPAAPEATGDAPLTPIQHWFLDAIPHHRDRWNQSYLLDVNHPLDAAQLLAIVRELVTHHDALRLRLVCRGDRWRQEIGAPNDAVPLRLVSLGDLPIAARTQRVAEECEREHAAMRIDAGGLFRCVAFEAADGWRRLLLLGHHLVLDGVSWSIILEDLAMLVTQAVAGQPLRLPERTTPARAYAIALERLAASADARAWAASWTSMPAEPDPRAERAGHNRDAVVVTLTIDGDDVRLLMQDAPRRFDASTQAIMLGALLLAWRDWTGSDALRLDVEGHGRDALGDACDVSRTVGWFTTVFPVHLALPVAPENGDDPPRQAVVTMAQHAIDALPLRGAAHGLARYLAPDESVRMALAAQPRPAVLFNLLGTHDVTLPPASRLRVTDEPQGVARDPDAPRPYLLEINARVESGALIITIEYSRQAHEAEDVARFATAFEDALRGMARDSSALAFPGVDAASLAIVADLLAELDEA